MAHFKSDDWGRPNVEFNKAAFGQNMLIDTGATFSLASTKNKNVFGPPVTIKKVVRI